MKQILYSLFYILSLGLSLGDLGLASSYDDETAFLVEPTQDYAFYDNEVSSDPGDVIAHTLMFAPERPATTLAIDCLNSPSFLAVLVADARGPPRVL